MLNEYCVLKTYFQKLNDTGYCNYDETLYILAYILINDLLFKDDLKSYVGSDYDFFDTYIQNIKNKSYILNHCMDVIDLINNNYSEMKPILFGVIKQISNENSKLRTIISQIVNEELQEENFFEVQAENNGNNNQ